MALLDRFTRRAKQVLSLAQEEARHFNHPYVGTEHILLDLVRDQDGVAGKVLDDLGVKLEQARSAVEFMVGHGEGPRRTDEAELTEHAKKAIERAVEESRVLKHHYIGTEHLLLGLVSHGAGVAINVLEIMGVSLEQVRTQVRRMVRSSAPEQASLPRRAPALPDIPRPRFDIFPTDAAQSAAPGTKITYSFDLTNRSPIRAAFELQVITTPSTDPTLPGVYAGLRQTYLELDHGQTVPFDVVVFIPQDTPNGADVRHVHVTAEHTSGLVSTKAVITTTVRRS
jgi:hypothetical protein